MKTAPASSLGQRQTIVIAMPSKERKIVVGNQFGMYRWSPVDNLEAAIDGHWRSPHHHRNPPVVLQHEHLPWFTGRLLTENWRTTQR
jgi:hypothetical protein